MKAAKLILYGVSGYVVGGLSSYVVGNALATPEGEYRHYGTKFHMFRHRCLGSFLFPSTKIMDVQAKFYPSGDDMNVYGAVCNTCGHVNVIDINSPKSLADGESRFAWVFYEDIANITSGTVKFFKDACNCCDYWEGHQKIVITEDGRRISAHEDCVNNYLKSKNKQ